MSSHNRDIAAAFSGHRFRETYDHLAPNIVWVAAESFGGPARFTRDLGFDGRPACVGGRPPRLRF